MEHHESWISNVGGIATVWLRGITPRCPGTGSMEPRRGARFQGQGIIEAPLPTRENGDGGGYLELTTSVPIFSM